jgi:hypothetical protein
MYSLMRSDKINRVLIICPVSVLHNWIREIEDHVVPHVKRLHVDLLSADVSKHKRQRILIDTFLSKSCRIVVSSYQLVANMIEDFRHQGYVCTSVFYCFKCPSNYLPYTYLVRGTTSFSMRATSSRTPTPRLPKPCMH